MNVQNSSRVSAKKINRRILLSAAVAGVSLVASRQETKAIDYGWINNPGSGGTANWANATNWAAIGGTASGLGYPNNAGSVGVGDTATLGSIIGTNTITITLDSNISLGAAFGTVTGQLTFSNTNANSGYVINSNGFLLDDGNGNGLITSSSTNGVQNTINSTIAATNTLTFNVAAGNLFAQGPVSATTLNKQGNGLLQLGTSGLSTVNNIGTVNLLAGTIQASQGPNGGTASITGNALGTGTLNVLGNNAALNEVADNSFTIGNLINFTTPVGTSGATFTILADRASSTNVTNKVLTFSNLNLGSTLGTATINVNGNNGFTQVWSNVTARGNLGLVVNANLSVGSLNELGTSSRINKTGLGTLSFAGASSFSGGILERFAIECTHYLCPTCPKYPRASASVTFRSASPIAAIRSS